MNRPYDQIAAAIPAVGEVVDRMQAVVDRLWMALEGSGVSWVGFYLYQGGDELFLGPRRNKPACSPIGLHGVCGQAFTRRQPIVVHDVRELGDYYIACDPNDRSEVVLPLFDGQGHCYAVLDLDSHDVGAFGQSDVEGLTCVLKTAGLTA